MIERQDRSPINDALWYMELLETTGKNKYQRRRQKFYREV
jgi:hypothetical protein